MSGLRSWSLSIELDFHWLWTRLLGASGRSRYDLKLSHLDLILEVPIDFCITCITTQGLPAGNYDYSFRQEPSGKKVANHSNLTGN